MQPPYPRWDWVQQVSQTIADAAVKAGQRADRQSLVFYGFHMTPYAAQSREAVAAKRTELGLPLDRNIVLSVGAVNSSQKRMDYVVQEVAKMAQPRPFLLLAGQQDEGTLEIVELASKMLGNDGFLITTVAHDRIHDYYQSADAFVLASLHEGFGRVFVEAMSHGLPCMAHDYEHVHSLLGKTGFYADFQQPGELTKLLCETLFQSSANQGENRRLRHRSVYERFSWDHLVSDYITMIHQCAGS